MTSSGRPLFGRIVWLMPAAFAVHIVEEFAGGFPEWVRLVTGAAMPVGAFLANNAAFMAILLGLTAWVSIRPSRLPAFALLAWASGNLFWNFVFHLATTMLLDRYSPGLVTAVLLYFPLSAVVAWVTLREGVLGRGAFAGAATVGAALMLLVIWARLFEATA